MGPIVGGVSSILAAQLLRWSWHIMTKDSYMARAKSKLGRSIADLQILGARKVGVHARGQLKLKGHLAEQQPWVMHSGHKIYTKIKLYFFWVFSMCFLGHQRNAAIYSHLQYEACVSYVESKKLTNMQQVKSLKFNIVASRGSKPSLNMLKHWRLLCFLHIFQT